MARVSEANTIPTSPDRDAYHDNGLKLPADGQLDNGVPVFTANARPPLVPPLNFSLVEDRIYRSGFPNPLNYPFLKQLGLKTIIYLGDLGQEVKKTPKQPKEQKEKKVKKDKHTKEDIWNEYNAWIGTTNIQFHHLVMESSQEPFTSLQEQQQARDSLRTALQLMLDKNNFPMLIHSNKGKHRIGVLVGLMRKIFQGWCMSGIFEEYEKFALGKSEFDLEFMELWQPELWVSQDSRPEFLRS
ncbi:protein-tyrosine phosphatase [Yamadazyma tenuis]|uniref:Protein-tyrosine phosphatase n=1 Tax=Candida tenuis (strain ATCC 10573 / BCRC 21748 / CBS 615 / JCM 9827 / NBRC 10315 / NRRL Y-1498 / VKM Y-70) TaxID=590646 RepID=G3BC03_CANTC|nr:protein-tyrosine phosphatase [Yamadazyma tenuis ATCC 10573]EGV61254.1 protein-tyrosine phosphatase [Yamadazyma tenuis ATCC 10573]WEJ93980.1 protein-tyrosine phosphatase [Yamadazyma tenuis]